MEKLFKYCVKKHGYKPCLGTRVILGEEDEKQANGKVRWDFCKILFSLTK